MNVIANPTLSYNKWLPLPFLFLPSFFPSIHLSVHPPPFLCCSYCLLPSVHPFLSLFPSAFLSPLTSQLLSLDLFLTPSCLLSLSFPLIAFSSFQSYNKHPLPPSLLVSPSIPTLHCLFLHLHILIPPSLPPSFLCSPAHQFVFVMFPILWKRNQ